MHSNLVYAFHFRPGEDDRTIAGQQHAWNQQFSEPLKRFILPHSNDPHPDRRLRIGYLSPDFRDHVIGRNLVPLFRNRNCDAFEIVCYSGVLRPDQLSQRLRQLTDIWHSTVGISDEALAEMIRADGIDILVDLTQHMAGNRLPVFARQPAPVQVSFAGYPARTGVEAIAYRISDRWLESGVQGAEGGEEKEQVSLIDSFWCYDPCGIEVEVNGLPAKETRCVTFGSLNNFCKINEPVLKLWAQVLEKVKGSRLILLSHPGSHRQRTLEFLAQQGVEPNRIEFVAPCPRQTYLELYHRLDVVLDPFPYGGHTTSLDALWMGVPVVSLAGKTSVSRAGLSILSNLGLPELVAFTEDDYVEIAVRLANNLPRLAELRATLRARVEASVLMDAPRFARQIEDAYRAMWRQWCAEEAGK
jgi:predicted O-linked N-acetylglucosamine transferase (SPINDLY family)